MNLGILSILFAGSLLHGISTHNHVTHDLPELGPQITFDTLIHDYGTIPFGADGRCSFAFTNTGDAPLIITSFRSSCGCLAPDFDKDPIPPGGRGSVRLRYDTRRVGPINKSATLTSNATNTPDLVLRIKGMVLADTASHHHPVAR